MKIHIFEMKRSLFTMCLFTKSGWLHRLISCICRRDDWQAYTYIQQNQTGCNHQRAYWDYIWSCCLRLILLMDASLINVTVSITSRLCILYLFMFVCFAQWLELKVCVCYQWQIFTSPAHVVGYRPIHSSFEIYLSQDLLCVNKYHTNLWKCNSATSDLQLVVTGG